MNRPEIVHESVHESVRESVRCYVALGANLGAPATAFGAALKGLDGSLGVQVLACSALYSSEPFEASGPPYLNAVCALNSTLTAPALLGVLQQLELDAGRVREFHHQPRVLDLDLLFFGQAQVQSPKLTLPHPRWFERAFVLLPLMEFEPSWVTPAMLKGVEDQTISRLEPEFPLWRSKPPQP